MSCLDRRWACVSYSACHRLLRAHLCRSFQAATHEWIFMQMFIHMHTSHTHTHSFCDYRFHQMCPQSDSVSSLLQEWTRNTATLPPPPRFPLWSCALYKMTQSTATATLQTGKPLAVYTTCTGSEGLDVYSVKHGLKMLDLQNKSGKT